MDDIKVSIFKRSSARLWHMQFRDPMSGRKVRKSTGETRQREAERKAAKWEVELREGRGQRSGKTTWTDFRDRYENEKLPSLADQTGCKVFTVFASVETILAPKRLSDLTSDRLSYYQSQLRAGKRTVDRNGKPRPDRPRAESTIHSYLGHLRAALRWAVKMKMLREAPAIEAPHRAKRNKAKGRPITGEEFERMLAKVEVVLFNPNNGKEKPDKPRKRKWTPPTPDPALVARVVESWQRYLEGLWLSGLRLTESRELWWDRDGKLRVDLTGRRPMLRIPAELEKGNKDRLLPITPDFAEFLLRTPKDERRGRVFPLVPQRKRDGQPNWRRVSRVICDIGRAAGVKVYTNPKTEAVKCASAHDLRRSFGARWARRVVPHVLMELMRHEDIKTTNDFYATHNAEATADVVWAAFERSEAALGVGASLGAGSQSAEEKPPKTSYPART